MRKVLINAKRISSWQSDSIKGISSKCKNLQKLANDLDDLELHPDDKKKYGELVSAFNTSFHDLFDFLEGVEKRYPQQKKDE